MDEIAIELLDAVFRALELVSADDVGKIMLDDKGLVRPVDAGLGFEEVDEIGAVDEIVEEVGGADVDREDVLTVVLDERLDREADVDVDEVVGRMDEDVDRMVDDVDRALVLVLEFTEL